MTESQRKNAESQRYVPDRDKVISGLESLLDICNAKADMAIGEGRTAWAGYASVVHLALDLLKEQEPVEPRWAHPAYDKTVMMCGSCGIAIPLGRPNYCPWCGRGMLWK